MKRVYQQIGKIAATLSAPDTLPISSPDTDQFNLYDEALAESLKGEDPLKSFASTPPPPELVSISNDDPRLKHIHARDGQEDWIKLANLFTH